mmetsp:Transcript_3429/g.5839  ORF Transcript_3429/g.5839 Transcript_3429/m.5839 type:complete len:453 (+) Transcript_3429:138-1496(+)
MEIFTEVWQERENSSEILHIKEKRPFGATRGNTSVPQVPELVVRIHRSKIDLLANGRRNLAVYATLWDYGASTGFCPESADSGTKFSKLRNGFEIKCFNHISLIGDIQNDGYAYAVLKCAISRAARILCKRRYIALKLECVRVEICSGEIKVTEIESKIPAIRTRRISISEKAMCPRSCDQGKKRGSAAAAAAAVAQASQRVDGAGMYGNPVNPMYVLPQMMIQPFPGNPGMMQMPVGANPGQFPPNQARGGPAFFPQQFPFQNYHPQHGILPPFPMQASFPPNYMPEDLQTAAAAGQISGFKRTRGPGNFEEGPNAIVEGADTAPTSLTASPSSKKRNTSATLNQEEGPQQQQQQQQPQQPQHPQQQQPLPQQQQHQPQQQAQPQQGGAPQAIGAAGAGAQLPMFQRGFQNFLPGSLNGLQVQNYPQYTNAPSPAPRYRGPGEAEPGEWSG